MSRQSSEGRENPPLTRKSLLIRLKNWQDEDSWQDFYKIYERLIRATARQSGLSDYEVQEVVQETLLSVAKKIAGFDYEPAKGSFKGWLMTITRRRIMDQFRKRHRADAKATLPPGSIQLDDLADPQDSRLEQLWNDEWNQALLEMARAVVKRHVSPKQYRMFDLFAVQQRPMKEVTRELGVNAAQVYMAKYRITRLLKKELKHLEDEL